MPMIKRYANRKLYDVEAKRYVTLDAIAEMVRAGADVQVIDHETGEDLTAVTLAQIIFEQAKKPNGPLPRALLARLVQAGGETVGTLRRALATPAEMARQVDDEIERRMQVLVEKGQLPAREAIRLQEQLLNVATFVASQPREAMAFAPAAIEQALAARGVPTREEVRKLSEQVEALLAQLTELETPVAAEESPPKPRSRKPRRKTSG